MQDFDLIELVLDLNSSDQQRVHGAYRSLVAFGESIVPELVESYERIGGSARLHVTRAFGEIGDARAVPLLAGVLRERAPDSYFMLPSLAAQALGRIGDEVALDALLLALLDENPGVRRMSTLVLGRFQAERAIEGLSRALRDSDVKVRVLAIDALRKIDTPHAWAVLDAAGYSI